MPRAKRICVEEGCLQPAVTGSSKCKAHAPKPWTRTSARNANRPPNWRTLRALVRARDKHTCKQCGRQGANEVDHIRPVSKGGGWELANLQTLCKLCHAIKTRLDRGY